jgi:nucleotide-binding universal stress UspA family protein
VALDGSEHSEKTLDLASDIGGKYGAELILPYVMLDERLSDAERYLAETEYLDSGVPDRASPG